MLTENSIFLEGRTKHDEQRAIRDKVVIQFQAITFTKYAKFTIQCTLQNIEAMHTHAVLFFCNNCDYMYTKSEFFSKKEIMTD